MESIHAEEKILAGLRREFARMRKATHVCPIILTDP